ncbi:MAG: hypothetical protein KJO21_00470 [Verrucomicrobiae bacterium]|nr:hypothetical protein [Verrucomicrobiae bacterium]NNJ42006.1 hypothetical protein [Akkermansiaceae bacterium]
MPPRRHIILLALFPCCFSSCGKQDPSKAPVINTPTGAKVDLSMISLVVSNPRITLGADHTSALEFDYTIHNQAGANIAFPCLYNETDKLIEVNLSDKEGNPVQTGRRPMEDLTLTEPRPLRILIGKTTRSYKVPLMPELRKKGDPINLRVRLHAPSRYDELRSSLEAPRSVILWP